MIELNRLNNSVITLNADFIVSVEATPDTVITLRDGQRYVVKNPVDDVVEKVITYHQQCQSGFKIQRVLDYDEAG